MNEKKINDSKKTQKDPLKSLLEVCIKSEIQSPNIEKHTLVENLIFRYRFNIYNINLYNKLDNEDLDIFNELGLDYDEIIKMPGFSELWDDLNILTKPSQTQGIEKLLQRLSNSNEYPGARYELKVAAYFKRKGFKLELLNDESKTHLDIKLFTNLPNDSPIYYIETYAQQYYGKEKELDRKITNGQTNKYELSNNEIETLINRNIKDKVKQIEKSNCEPTILMLNYPSEKKYTEICNKIINTKINISPLISCILFQTNKNIIKKNVHAHCSLQPRMKKILLELPSPNNDPCFLRIYGLTEAGLIETSNNKTDHKLNEKYKETELGLLPEDWDVIHINKYICFKRGTEPGSKNYNKEGKGVRFLRVTDLSANRGNIIYTDSKNIQTCNANDILIAFDGSPGILKKGLEGAYSSGIRKVIIKDKKITLDYIYYVLQTNFVKEIITKYSTGVTIKHASKSISHILITLPPLSEQQKIAYVLSTIQEALEKTEQVINATKELKKSMMKHLFSYGPVSLEDINKVKLKETELGLLPEDWEIVKFEECLSKEKYNVSKIKQYNYKKIGLYPIIDQGQNIIVGYWNNKEDLYDGKLPIILFGDHTRIFKFIDFPFICGGDGAKVLVARHGVDTKYFYYYLSTLNIPSRGYNRHYSLLKENKIPLPPLQEQQKIASILSAIDEKIKAEDNKKNALEKLFKSMLHNLMTAKIRVKDIEI